VPVGAVSVADEEPMFKSPSISTGENPDKFKFAIPFSVRLVRCKPVNPTNWFVPDTIMVPPGLVSVPLPCKVALVLRFKPPVPMVGFDPSGRLQRLTDLLSVLVRTTV
jgi:hypothetical protein